MVPAELFSTSAEYPSLQGNGDAKQWDVWRLLVIHSILSKSHFVTLVRLHLAMLHLCEISSWQDYCQKTKRQCESHRWPSLQAFWRESKR